MSGMNAMIRQMERWLGTGEPNAIQSWYRARNGSDYSGNFAWCNALITRAAVESGNYDAVCFGTDYAYTVAHAAKFAAKGQWTAMTNGIQGSGIQRGDIIFFDWDGSSSISAIDHVGIVTGVSGGNVYTIEGNTANVCARRVRGVHEIAGFGRPRYTGGTPSTGTPARYQVTVGGLRYGYGARGPHVTKVGQALVAKGFGKYYEEGPGPEWSDADTRNFSDFQISLGYQGTAPGQDADGVPGAASLAKLLGTTAPPFPGRDKFRLGAKNGYAKQLQTWLAAGNWGPPYKVGPSDTMTALDIQKAKALQAHYLADLGPADGDVGPRTWQYAWEVANGKRRK